MDWLEQEFGTKKPLIGVVHLLPLPGSPGYGGSLDEIFSAARRSARVLWDAGFDSVMFENFGDVPFHPDHVDPHVVGIVSILVAEFADRGPCGVNLLRNAARDALAAAVAGGGRIVRVNVHTGAAVADQGLLVGSAHETVRYRQRLGADTRILADVHVKHAVPLVARDIIVEAQDCIERGRADGIIVTGPRTGEPADLAEVKRLKAALPQTPIFVGSGVSVGAIDATLAVADGVIVSTSLEKRLGEIDAAAAKAFVVKARRL